MSCTVTHFYNVPVTALGRQRRIRYNSSLPPYLSSPYRIEAHTHIPYCLNLSFTPSLHLCASPISPPARTTSALGAASTGVQFPCSASGRQQQRLMRPEAWKQRSRQPKSCLMSFSVRYHLSLMYNPLGYGSRHHDWHVAGSSPS